MFLMVLQRYRIFGPIDPVYPNKSKNQSVDNIEKLFKLMKDKIFTEVRKWVAVNNDFTSVVQIYV